MYVRPVERRLLHSNIAQIAMRLFIPDVAAVRRKMKCQFIVIIVKPYLDNLSRLSFEIYLPIIVCLGFTIVTSR
jgi:hypothetical protein